jgi:pyrroline-5-carboxylate reductase
MTLKLPGPLLLVGAGNMGGALLAGWLGRELDPNGVFVQDPSPSAAAAAMISERNIATGAPPSLPAPPCAVVLAVKPQALDAVLPPLASVIGAASVVMSVAAGRTLASIGAHLPGRSAIVRAMPNTPAAIGRGISVACANPETNDAQKSVCTALLEAVGAVAWVEDEAQLDAVTAVSGSGPAYVFLLAECLAEAGVEQGLDPDLAVKLAVETVAGAGELLRQSGRSAAALREAVTSPQGTTAAALSVLMGEEGLNTLISRAVAAAAKRAKELSS